ncbi:MAG: amidohydrolase [Clostridia bacterium]|nr:amidohydrolase [Clostridia bacterium]
MYNYEIIDFHTHPFLGPEQSICAHADHCTLTTDGIEPYFRSLGISKICGSVVYSLAYPRSYETWEPLHRLNESALELQAKLGDFYVPGFHVHPYFYEESCKEIERMASLGVRLVGELVPYLHGWDDYSLDSFSAIIDEIQRHDMVLNVHSMSDDSMDIMVSRHPNAVIVGAHPGDFGSFDRQMKRMAMSENYYIDLSGHGLFRYGLLRNAINLYGAERFLFGSDYPICNPPMYIAGVAGDPLITEEERKLILSGNAKRLLRME